MFNECELDYDDYKEQIKNLEGEIKDLKQVNEELKKDFNNLYPKDEAITEQDAALDNWSKKCNPLDIHGSHINLSSFETKKSIMVTSCLYLCTTLIICTKVIVSAINKKQ